MYPADWPAEIGDKAMKRGASLIFIIYIVVGIVIAVSRHYITVALLKGLASALLCVFLWFLPLLGVNLHLN